MVNNYLCTTIEQAMNFLNLMSYSLHETKGLHHKIFVDENVAKSESYKRFWEDLKNGTIP